jgi:hypothetical protein
MNLLRYSVVLAQQQQTDLLTLEILAAAYNLRLAEHVRKGNPFERPTTRPVSPFKSARSSGTVAGDHPVKCHKKPSAAEVLTTH